MQLKVCRFGVVPEEAKFRVALEERPRALSKKAVHKISQVAPVGDRGLPELVGNPHHILTKVRTDEWGEPTSFIHGMEHTFIGFQSRES